MRTVTPHDIYVDMLRQISEEKFLPGNRLPSERELAKSYGTNRMTVHYALNLLSKEKVVLRRRPAGTFVTEEVNPNILRKLRNRNSRRILVIDSHSEKRSYHWIQVAMTTIIKSIEDQFDVSYGKLPMDSGSLERFFDNLEKDEIKAVLIFPEGERELAVFHNNIETLEDYSGDIFLYDRTWLFQHAAPCNLISVDFEYEGRLAARRLKKNRHKSIAFFAIRDLAIPLKNWEKGRLRGVLQIYGDHVKELMIDQFQPDYSAVKDFLASRSKPGIVSRTSKNSKGLIEFARTLELQPGRDYDLITFDDDPECRHLNLTTVAPPLGEIGDLLANIIAGRLERHDDLTNIKYYVKSKTIKGQTCG